MRLNLEEWRFLTSPFYDIVRSDDARDAEVVVEVQEGHGLLLTKVAVPAELLVHDPRSRKSICHDFLLFERFFSGGGKAEVGEVPFTVHPSRLHVIDMSRHYVSLKDANASEGVLIPHHMVGYDPSVDPAFASIDIFSGRGQLLEAGHQLMRARIHAGHEDAAMFVGAFLDLVQRFMLRRDPSTGLADVDVPLPALLRQYIHANLSSPTLSTEALMANFGVSRAVLYRLFEKHGGVMRYIRNCRLERCLFELSSVPATRGSISAVAKRWRFNDPSHFNRLFRQRFGAAPSELIGRPSKDVALMPTEVATVTHGWIADLVSD
jgi:AraC-like DNA-binding protein